MNILELNEVTQLFGQLAAVKNLSFEVEKGEIFGIAGPNGAGKTTLFNVISGFYQGSGDIILDGRSIKKLRPHKICRMGIARTFQIPQLFLTLPMVENVRVGAHFGFRGAQNEGENIAKVIDLVGLQGKENVLASNLNLFDKKLTMLAIAMATNPKVLLVDEPIGGLSLTEGKELVGLIRKVNEELGVTILIIEHLMKVLTELCDRLMIMDNGGRFALGPPVEVCSDEKVIEVYLGKGKHA